MSIEDTQFYWSDVTQELNGNQGTIITYELLQTQGERTEIIEHNPRTELYLYKNVLFDWDIIFNQPISVINIRTEEYLFLNPKVKKGARSYAKDSGNKRWTDQKFTRRLNREPLKRAKRKRRLQKFKARRN